MQRWISVVDAIRLAGVSERTIRRWAKEHPESTKKENKGLLVDGDKLAKFYPFESAQSGYGSSPEHDTQNAKTNQMQIVSYSETITKLSEQIERRDHEIKLLLNRRSKMPFWLCVGFIALLGGLYMTFNAYTKQTAEETRQRITEQFLAKNREIELIESKAKQVAEIKDETINSLKQENSQQRLELAQKDRLIAELYNDTKAQNKKLLELTESLQAKSAKTDQFENNSVKN